MALRSRDLSDDEARRLADEVLRLRGVRSQTDIAADGGPETGTISRVERAIGKSISYRSLRQLSSALVNDQTALERFLDGEPIEEPGSDADPGDHEARLKHVEVVLFRLEGKVSELARLLGEIRGEKK